jgi:hypothetical protein
MRSRAMLIGIPGMLAIMAGCNWLTPLIFVGEHKKEVAAEFNKLAGNRMAVLLWAPPETLFDYQYARFELASYISDKLAAEMASRQLTLEIVDPRDVEDFIGKERGAELDPARVGKHFDADYVVYVELTLFQIRDPDQPQFVQGRISASVCVYDIQADPDMPQRFELTPVDVVFPERGPMVMSPTNSLTVREQTYRKFAEVVARKFYDYTVDL